MNNWWSAFGNDNEKGTNKPNDDDGDGNGNGNDDSALNNSKGTRGSLSNHHNNKVSFIFRDDDEDEDDDDAVPDPELAVMPSSDEDDEDDSEVAAAAASSAGAGKDDPRDDDNEDGGGYDEPVDRNNNQDAATAAADTPPETLTFQTDAQCGASTFSDASTANVVNNHQQQMQPQKQNDDDDDYNADRQIISQQQQQQQLPPPRPPPRTLLLGNGKKSSSSSNKKGYYGKSSSRSISGNNNFGNNNNGSSGTSGNHQYIRSSMIMNNPEEPVMSYTAHPGPSYRQPLLTCRRFWSELYCCQPWFYLTERANQRELDIRQSFAPSGTMVFVWKCILCGLCVGTLTYEFLTALPTPLYQLAYLSQWTSIATTLYVIMSTINTIWSARTPQPPAETTGLRIRITWILFALAVHLGATVTLLYWSLLYDPTKENQMDYLYLDVANHGGLFVLVLIDGWLVNRIPLRWMHYFGIILPIEALYAVWTYLHYRLQIGNPNNNNDNDNNNNNNANNNMTMTTTGTNTTDIDDEDDDALYPNVIEWGDGQWREPLMVIVILLLAVGPVIFCLFWCIANGLPCCRDRRRYFDDPVNFFDDENDNENENDHEDDHDNEGGARRRGR